MSAPHLAPSALRSLSVVLPAYNEADNVGAALDAVLRHLDGRGIPGEVIVVDDGSADGTHAVVADRATRDDRVRLLRHDANRGYGAALRSGIHVARGEHIFVMDADLQYDITELVQLEAWAGSFDIIVGYRRARRDPWNRLVNAWGWNLLVNRMFRLGVRDVDCAFKIFHRRVFDHIGIRSAGAFVSSEILVRARAAGFRVKEVPVTHFPRRAGAATGARPRVIGRACLDLGRFYAEHRRR